MSEFFMIYIYIYIFFCSLSLKLELNRLFMPFASKIGLVCIFYTLKIVPGIMIILSANTISHIN